MMFRVTTIKNQKDWCVTYFSKEGNGKKVDGYDDGEFVGHEFPLQFIKQIHLK